MIFGAGFENGRQVEIEAEIGVYSRPGVGYFPGMKLISWNVNGLRAVLKKNFLEFLAAEQPDILCLQETKCTPDDVERCWPGDYATYWNCAEKKGYSGTAVFTRRRPVQVTPHLGIAGHDREGLERLPYRQVWDADLLKFLKRLERQKPVIFCGDLNVAHTEIDLANPKANVRNHGFTLEERNGFTAFIHAGLVDTFREFEKGGGHYSWWSPLSGARARNIGWRIDYVLISPSLRPRLKQAFIRPQITGSDHCPVGIELA